MALPTSVNGQITDAVTQSALMSLGTAPATALGAQQQVWAHAMGIGFENAAARQQAGQTLAEAFLSAVVADAKGALK